MMSLVAVVAMGAAALPPLPPVEPDFPGPPQPNCTTCKFPHEGCSGNNDTITMLRDLTARATAMGTQFNYNCHSKPGVPNSTLAAFLIGAGKGHYIGIGGWNDPTYNKLDTHWQPEFDLPLGNPASDGEYNLATATWTRRFQSAYVTFNAKTNEGAIQWGKTSRPS
jgi:hypothetical protein